jgi:nucleotide-binding universal stress UspA family protein
MDTHESNESHGLVVKIDISPPASAEAAIRLLEKAVEWLESAGDSVTVRGTLEIAHVDQAEPDHGPEPAAPETDYHFPPFRG